MKSSDKNHSHWSSASEEDTEPETLRKWWLGQEEESSELRDNDWSLESWDRKVKVRKLAHCLRCSKNSLLISFILSLQGVSQTICLMPRRTGYQWSETLKAHPLSPRVYVLWFMISAIGKCGRREGGFTFDLMIIIMEALYFQKSDYCWNVLVM